MRVVTVGEIIGGGFRLVRTRIAAVAIWALLYLAINIAVLYFSRPFMTNMMTLQAARSGGVPPAAMFDGMGAMFGIYLVMLLGLLVLYTAALRAAMRPAESAFAYLRIGMDELRMLAVAFILLVGFFILYFLLVMIATLIGGLVGFIARDAIVVVPVVIVLTVAVICVLVLLQVRFSLAFALTLLRGKIVIGESWTLTKGRFWTLFGAYFVLLLIVFASAMPIFAITTGGYFAELARAHGDPAAINAAAQSQMARQFGAVTATTVVGWLLGAILGAFWITLGAGAAGAATTALLDDAFADVGAIYE